MKVINCRSIGVVILAAGLLVGCSDDNIVERQEAAQLISEDVVEIEAYIQEKGYTDVDTTESRVRYLITNEGTGEKVENNDIVSLHYAGRFLDDELFETSIDTIDINNDTFDSTRVYAPIVFTHTESGWAADNAFNLVGLSDGVTASLKKLNVGGSARVIIPAPLANGIIGTVQLNGREVVVFDIYPVRLRK